MEYFDDFGVPKSMRTRYKRKQRVNCAYFSEPQNHRKLHSKFPFYSKVILKSILNILNRFIYNPAHTNTDAPQNLTSICLIRKVLIDS